MAEEASNTFRNSFKYLGTEYLFSAKIQNFDDKNSKRAKFDHLDTAEIEMFSYENKMNQMIQTGYMIYNDTQGTVAKYLKYQYVCLGICLIRYEERSDGKAESRKLSDIQRIFPEFIIDNYEILHSEPGLLKYKLHLVGVYATDLCKTFSYTNYQDGEKPITDIIREILKDTKINIPIGQDTFGNHNDTSVKYISNGTDTVLEAIRSLQRKQFCGQTRDKHLTMIAFNDRKREYELFSMKKDMDWQYGHAVDIDVVQRSQSPIEINTDVNVAFVTNKPNLNTIRSFFPRTIKTYDIENNSFGDISIGPTDILNLYSLDNDIQQTSKTILENIHNSTILQSEWNNTQDIFLEQIENLVENNGLKVNIEGRVGMTPGDIVNISMHRGSGDIHNASSTDGKAQIAKAYQDKFKGLTGKWYVSRVVTKIDSKDGAFRQVLSLMRNWDKDVLGDE